MEMIQQNSTELRAAALFWLSERDATRKAEGVRRLADDWRMGRVTLDSQMALDAPTGIPGHPDQPELVPPLAVKRRTMVTAEGLPY